MLRKAKIKSNNEIYYIMTKGINKEKIFQKEVHNNKKEFKKVLNISDDSFLGFFQYK